MASLACVQCQKTAAQVSNMKRCAKCQSTPYCSRECQRAHWKTHKKVCASNAANNASSSGPNIEHSTNYKTARVKNLEKQIPNPFTRLDNGTYLHDRSEKDVFKLLIDAFRMRQADAFKFEGRKDPNSVYTGAPSSINGFRHFMRLASSRRNRLPSWWTAEKQKECEEFGENGGNWSSLKTKVDKEAVIAHYGEQKMPMQLRMFAEEVYGTPPAGSGSGTAMRKMMATMEAGGDGSGHVFSMMGL